jgi:TolB protein
MVTSLRVVVLVAVFVAACSHQNHEATRGPSSGVVTTTAVSAPATSSTVTARPAAASAQLRIAFSRGGPDGGIHVMTGPARAITRITKDPGDDQPAWSPAGTEIVFNRYINGRQNIYVMRPDGSAIRRLTTDGSSSSPGWSPDGSRIVFARETPGNADIYTMKPDGTDVTRLTHDALREYTPVWSPDGSSIAFVAGPTRIYVMHADGSNARSIGPDNAALPRWAPDGSKIAFVDETTGSIKTMNRDGTGLRRIVDVTTLAGGTAFAANFTWPTWSTDGTKILFAAGSPTSSHLYTVGADGTGFAQWTTGSVTDESPAWAMSSPSAPTASDALVFDDTGGVVTFDPTTNIATHHPLDGWRPGDQPFLSLRVEDSFVIGWGDVHASTISGRASYLLGTGVFVPAAERGAVWLTSYGGVQTATERLVDMHGRVLLEGAIPSGIPLTGVPGGLVMQNPGGLDIWDARSGRNTQHLGTTTGSAAPAFGSLIAWCDHCNESFELTDVGIRAARGAAGSRSIAFHLGGASLAMNQARFSPDGTHVAIPATPDAAARAGASTTIAVVGVATGRISEQIDTHQRYASIAWSPDSQRLYIATSSGSEGGRVLEHDLPTKTTHDEGPVPQTAGTLSTVMTHDDAAHLPSP